jgi:hypothetical protein
MSTEKNPPEMITQHGSLHAPEIPDPKPEVAEAVQGADTVMEPLEPIPRVNAGTVHYFDGPRESASGKSTSMSAFSSPKVLGEGETAVRTCPDCGERYFMGHVCDKKPG